MHQLKLLKDTLVVLAISLALLVAAELTLRVIFPEKIRNIPENELAYVFNKDYLVSLKPNIEKIYVRSEQNGGDIIHWRTNNDSFRGENLQDNPETRIIVYGDSNIQARFSEEKNTYTARLEQYLNAAGVTDIEVVNAGIIGFGPDQSLIRFRQEADRYNPDLVIFHIFADNDFGDILRNRLFHLDADHNLLETNHGRTSADTLFDRKPRNFVSSLLIVRAAKTLPREIRSFFGHEKEDRFSLLMNHAEEEFSAYQGVQDGLYYHFFDHYDIDLALDPDMESSRIKAELMEAILRTANNLARSKSIEFLVVIQPSVIDSTIGNAVLDYEFMQKNPKYRRKHLSDTVENICIENRIECINFYEVFMRNNPETLFFKGENDHWNDRGQDVAAKETAAYITGRNILATE